MSKNKDIVALELMSELKNYNRYVNNLMLEHIHKSPVLDFGSGFGNFCQFLETSGFISHGLEIDSEAIEESKKKNIKTFHSISQIEDCYPVVTSLNVIEHIEDDRKALADIKKIIEEEGLLVLYVPASMKAWSQMDVDAGHHRRYEKSDIIEKLTENNFKIIHFQYKDFAGWLILVLFRLLRIKPKFNKRLIIFYDTYFFPILKMLDFIGGRFIGKNMLVVAKHTKQ
jgi:2-polyprenyl-3-methyl-5-hydroxy-6-metoxy-1,4-benzoquinol methylase